MKTWRKHLSVLLAVCLILSSLGALLTVSAQEGIVIPVAYDNFSSPSCEQSLVLSGLSDAQPDPYGPLDLRAILQDGSINLTAKQWQPNFGAAFAAKPVALGTDRSFSTFFTFSLTGELAEGFIFTMNGEGDNMMPASRGALGVSTQTNAISIEFDTFDNQAGQGDMSDEHITYVISSPGGIDYRQSLNLKETGVSLRDSQLKYAWIDYDGQNDVLTVTLSNENDRSTGAQMVVEGAGVKSHLLSTNVTPGFIGATWNQITSQCIHSWYMDSVYAPIDTANNTYVAGGNIQLGVTASLTSQNTAVANVTVTGDMGPVAGAKVDLMVNGQPVDTAGLTTDESGKLAVPLSDVKDGAEITALYNKASASTTVLNFSDFNTAGDQLKLTGLSDSNPDPYGPYDLRAKNVNGELRMTTKHWTPNYGAAFYGKRIQLGSDYSFSTFFTYTISGERADGFAFTLNTNTPSATSGHNNLGVQQVNNNISIEFDTYSNGGATGDPDGDGNHLGYTYGNGQGFTFKDTQHLETVDLADGQMKYVWIDFNGATDTLDVTVSNSTDRAAGETMSLYLPEFKQNLGTNLVYAGFTVSTYNQNVQNDFYSWYFNSEYAPIDAAGMLAGKVADDLNNDGAFNAGDVIFVKDRILHSSGEQIPLSGRGQRIADRNSDGQVNVLDAVLMKRALAGF